MHMKCLIITTKNKNKCFVRLSEYKIDNYFFNESEFKFLEKLANGDIAKDTHYTSNWNNPFVNKLEEMNIIEIDPDDNYYIPNIRLCYQVNNLSKELKNLNNVQEALIWTRRNMLEHEYIFSPNEFLRQFYYEKYSVNKSWCSPNHSYEFLEMLKFLLFQIATQYKCQH